MANKHVKRCSTSYVIREMQGRTTRHHSTPVSMAKARSTDNTKGWRGCGATGTLLIAGGNAKLVPPLRKMCWCFLKKLNIDLPDNPAITLLYPKENLCSHKNLHRDGYSSFLHNCQMEATKRCPSVLQ